MARISKEYAFVLEDFNADCEARQMTAETIRRYLSSLGIYAEYLEQKRVIFQDIQNSHVIDFISYLRNVRKVKTKTLNNYLSAMNALYDYLLFNGLITTNIIPPIRKRYATTYKKQDGSENRRKTITPSEMSVFLNSIQNPRDKAMATLFIKTGIRRGELIAIDLKDIDWRLNCINLKGKAKRSNLTVFFDNECARVLRHWIRVRETLYIKEGCDALFISNRGERLKRQGVYKALTDWAKRQGIFDTESPNNSDHFSPHNLRHCFTTYLLENGMKREYVQELRGDARRDAVDIYHHNPREKLREAYLVAMPQFGL